MRMKCIVKGCENHKDEGGFEDGMCLPCYLFITTGEGIYSQAYRNARSIDTITDKELIVFLMDEIDRASQLLIEGQTHMATGVLGQCHAEIRRHLSK